MFSCQMIVLSDFFVSHISKKEYSNKFSKTSLLYSVQVE